LRLKALRALEVAGVQAHGVVVVGLTKMLGALWFGWRMLAFVAIYAVVWGLTPVPHPTIHKLQ
jgi:hypothetical protein